MVNEMVFVSQMVNVIASTFEMNNIHSNSRSELDLATL